MIAQRFAFAFALTGIASVAVASFTSVARAENIFGADDSAESPSALGAPKQEPAIRPGFGARIGGYGFRRTTDGKWDDCRMNGLGVFGTLDFGKYFFGELGLDSYSAVKTGGPDDGMDRISMLTSVAAGVRMFPDWYVTPYVELGTGLEWTRVKIDNGGSTTGTYPIGFFGVGADLNVVAHLKLGMVMRVLAMPHPNDPADDGIVYQHPAAPTMEYQPAAQGQFYLRYVL
jgi:hypothetical protein